jgi:hypothetical protein
MCYGKYIINMNISNISIREAASRLGVSLNTLRNWDESGILKSSRSGPRSHRFYPISDIESFLANKSDHLRLAKNWVLVKKGFEPDPLFYCGKDIFPARLERMGKELSQDARFAKLYSLIVLVAGEIGNNSFDHNLGNWPDVPGIFFAYNIQRGEIVLADRGRGVLETLRRVKPELIDDAAALKVAFTEMLSGRSPESRGNGLKSVRKVVISNPVSVSLQSRSAIAELKKNRLSIKLAKRAISGCLAVINFKV